MISFLLNLFKKNKPKTDKKRREVCKRESLKDRATIAKLASKGAPISQLAHRFKVSEATIKYHILQAKNK